MHNYSPEHTQHMVRGITGRYWWAKHDNNMHTLVLQHDVQFF